MFLAVGKLDSAHNARGPTPHGRWVPPFAVGECGRRDAAAIHCKRGDFSPICGGWDAGGLVEVIPPTADEGKIPPLLWVVAASHLPHSPTAKGGTNPLWGVGPRAWWAESNFKSSLLPITFDALVSGMTQATEHFSLLQCHLGCPRQGHCP